MRFQDISELSKYYTRLVEHGVDSSHLDKNGRSALFMAVRSGNLAYIKFLVDEMEFDPTIKDILGATPVNHLLKGGRLLKASVMILKYLVSKSVDLNSLYHEKDYKGIKGDYKTTSLIHCIRNESENRDHIKDILKVLLQGKRVDPSMQDSDGRDAFMYIAIRNHANTFNFI